MKFFTVTAPGVWGDYGDLLFGGMTQRLGRRKGQLQLERTGPFMPPISLGSGWDLIVTEEMRKKIAISNLGKVQFRPLIKKKIVLLHWEKWSRKKPLPREYDLQVAEPEDYILNQPHSEEASRQMGDVYEVVLPKCGRCRDLGYDADQDYFKWSLDISGWDDSHIFLSKAPGDYVLFVSEVGKRWIEKEAPGWLKFGIAETGSS